MRSLMTRLKMSDQVSSPATWMPAARAACASRALSGLPDGQRRHQIDAREFLERRGHGEPLRRGERIAHAILESPFVQAGGLRALGEQRGAVGHQRLVGFVGAIPFQQRELGMMYRAALAVAEHAGEGDDLRLAGRQQLLAGEFGRGVQMHARAPAVRRRELGGEGVQVGFIARRDLQDRHLDFDEAVAGKPVPQGRLDAPASRQERPAGRHRRWDPTRGRGRSQEPH